MMSDLPNKPTTRRVALKTGLGLLGAAGAVSLAAATKARAQSAKADPSTVGYVTKSATAGQACSSCASFIAPGACVLVSGAIAPAGWCQLYSPKS
jgi:hypothetical protein